MHKNAKSTPAGRVQAVRRVVGGEPVGLVAHGLGMSRRRLHEWVRRWEAGDQELRDRSSRPHRSPQRLRRGTRRQIARLRRARWSSLRIAEALGVPVPTVVREQQRLGLARLPRLAPPVPVVRYERQWPGEWVHAERAARSFLDRVWAHAGRGWRPRRNLARRAGAAEGAERWEAARQAALAHYRAGSTAVTLPDWVAQALTMELGR